MTIQDDINTVRKALKHHNAFSGLEAMDRIKAALPKPTFEKGFYQYAVSGLYWTNGEGEWWDVTNGYEKTTYPNRVGERELVRLYRADEVSALA